MKKYFITGLVLLLPIILTIVIVTFVFNLLTEPFLGIAHPFFNAIGVSSLETPFLNSLEVQTLLVQVAILILLVTFTVVIGKLAQEFFMHSLLNFWDHLIHQIPFVNTIYKTSKDVIKTIFHPDSKSFKQVVLVPFPSEDTRSIGLITREDLPIKEMQGLIGVFVPTTPNPTSGYLLMYKKQDLIYLDMSVEEAFKYVISCGVLPSKFKLSEPS